MELTTNLREPLATATASALRGAAGSLLDGCAGALDRAVAALADASRTARFLRGRLGFRARPDDVFVSSYPRSGTTWTQFILYLLTRGDRAAEFEHLSQVSPWWERSLAWGNAGAADFDRLPGPRIFKSHLPYAWLPRGARYVYVQRQVEDVAVSYYHLYRSHLGYQGSFAAFFERFLRGDLQYGSWFKHVAGWERQRGNPRVLFLRYEDMTRDPEGAIRALAGLAGVAAPDADIAAIARASSFQAMKASEDKFDHIGELRLARGIRAGMFLRSGTSDQGRAYLSAAQRDRLDAARRTSIKRPEIEWRLPDFLH